MKKILLLISICIFLISCINQETHSNKYKYSVIDTTHVSINGFGTILGYDLIIKIDSTYYSASTSIDGIEIDRQLVNVKSK